MIKEKSKKIKQKTKAQILTEYLRTIGVSFLVALIFTVLLSLHARSEMIKNQYANLEEQEKLDEQIARQLVTQSDLTKGLRTKKYAVCMQVGNIYETAGDYENAQLAFEYALQKAPAGVYAPYYKLASVLIAQSKYSEAEALIGSVYDENNKSLIKFKTRAYITMGDKYYSVGKFLSAAKAYVKAEYYYSRFAKKDKVVEKSIATRIENAYIETADVMVKNGSNSDAVRFLKKAEKYNPNSFKIRYKLAIVYADLDPTKSVEYFEPLLDKMPQDIDYGVYTKALMKAANIADLNGLSTQAKYYRYKIHSVDLFINQKVVYKNDVEIMLENFRVKKFLFRYKVKAKFLIKNVSNSDIKRLSADFVLRQGDKVSETITQTLVTKDKTMYANSGDVVEPYISIGKGIYTRRELDQYVLDIYLYKDEKYKTLVSTIPINSVYQAR